MKRSILKGNVVRAQNRTLAFSVLTALIVLTSSVCQAQASDEREVIELNPVQRAHVLGEMRAMLAGTQAIIAALAKDDMAAVARQASALGMTMPHKPENHIHDVLPPAFMQLGMSVHRDFDRIASDAETVNDPKHTLQQLSTTMNTCSVCHDAYQIQTSASQR